MGRTHVDELVAVVEGVRPNRVGANAVHFHPLQKAVVRLRAPTQNKLREDREDLCQFSTKGPPEGEERNLSRSVGEI